MKRSEMVQKYLQILGLNDRQPDFKFLNDIIERHVATFAFSSVGCRLGENLPLDFEALFQRIVVNRRGGYCFEQNGLLFGILEDLNFSPELYLARVIYNQDIHPGLTHRISVVTYEGQKYLLDAGFGSDGPRIPVSMSGSESNDGDKVFRIEECSAGEFHLQVFRDGDFFSLYRFELSQYGEADCELGHFYSHRHPEAIFVNHLVVSLNQAQETRSLYDLEYRVITTSGTQKKKIRDCEQLRRILVDELGVLVTEAEGRRLYKDLSAQL
ncbi:MAG: arylamine N-acetyltransferase [Desulfobacterales bacterium]|nr:arylamine N-acetyltransferase [Desulfobacterales bacterium]